MTIGIGAPIMILGIRPRSGTNYLCDIINQHPDVARPTPIDEDYFLAHADKLESFAQGLGSHWNNLSRPVPPSAQEDVLAALGVGLLGWLTVLSQGKRVLTKSPLPGRMDLFPKLFPSAKLLIIVRDGRSVVESHMRSWPQDGRFGPELFSGLIKEWVKAAETIQRFREQHAVTDHSYMLVRYEDLVREPIERVTAIIEFLELDAGLYDFGALSSLPVRGSSSFGRAPGHAIDWKPIKRTADFDPIMRWDSWTADQHRTFNQLAGRAMSGFGYLLER